MTAFNDPDLLEQLERLDLEAFDDLSFGLIVMDRTSRVIWYNAWESRHAGLSVERVVGHQFFDHIGVCMNNYLVAQRFLDEPDLDAEIDYVFTLRMKPTPVRLRLLARADSVRQYLAVHRVPVVRHEPVPQAAIESANGHGAAGTSSSPTEPAVRHVPRS